MTLGRALVAFALTIVTTPSFGLTANKVWFELMNNGRFRVTVNYTVPALREFREVTADFSKKPEAEKFYWDLVKGGDFYLTDAKTVRFNRPPLQPQPW